MRVARALCWSLLSAGPLSTDAPAQDSLPAPRVAFGAFADVYYAYDFGRPPSGDRAYTTQPARHDEFNVNLAHVEARLTGDRVRGRVALQAGTSVQRNYAAEPTNGDVSGPEVTRHIQEAVAGVRLGEGLWVDAGIYFAHIGQEGWISRDNPTYSRSLTADFTPYYSAGARVTWEAAPSLRVQAHVVNGWQIVSENNGDKAFGARVDWQVSPALLLGYDNFFGNEQPDSLPAATRVFNEVFAKLTPRDGTDLWLTANVGAQGDATWYSLTLVARQRLSARVAVNARVERYADPQQIIVATEAPAGLESWGASVGADVAVADRALWRTELRGFRADAALYPDGDGPPRRVGGFVVSSLAVSF